MEKKDFLKSIPGRRWFYKKTKGMHRQLRYILKKRIIDPPKYIIEWLKWDKEIREEIERQEKGE